MLDVTINITIVALISQNLSILFHHMKKFIKEYKICGMGDHIKPIIKFIFHETYTSYTYYQKKLNKYMEVKY